MRIVVVQGDVGAAERSEAVTNIRGVQVVRGLAAVGGRIVDFLQAASIRWVCATRATATSVCVVEFLLECLDVVRVALRRHREVTKGNNWQKRAIQRGS